MVQQRSVATRRTVVLCIAVVVLFFGKIFYDIHTDRDLAISSAEQHAKGLANALNEHALRTFNNAEVTIDSVIRGITALSPTGIPDEKQLHQLFAGYQRPGSVIATLFVATPKGRLQGISSELPVRQVEVADREYFQHHLNSRDPALFISKPFRNRLDNQWLITSTKRLDNPDGSLRMIVGVAIRTRYFSSFYSTLGLGQKDRILLIRSDGELLSLEPFSERILLANQSDPERSRPELGSIPGSGTYQVARTAVDDTGRIISFRSSAAYPVIAVISLETREQLGPWRARAVKDLAGAALFMALSASLALLILRQLASLKKAKVAEEALRLSEQRFRELLENIHLVSVILDTSGRVTFCNDYLLELTGWSRAEVLGADWFDLFLPQPDLARRRDFFETGVRRGEIPAHYEHSIVTRGGDWRSISWDNTVLHHPDGSLAGIASIGRDLTQHRALEDQLRQSQKMEATGLLAGGIAHDFNNILTVIIGYCSIMQMRMDPGDVNLASVEQVVAAAERAAGLTRSLLAFSRKQVMNPRPVDLNGIVRHVEQFLGRVIGEDIALKSDLHGGELWVLADSSQIEQIIMNLATNARDAMPGGGTLSITTRPTDLDATLAGNGSAPPGRYALLSVSDDGIGMDAGTQAKIFEPFYTTKEVGKGTGLGLAMVYGTVMQHNGQIVVESEPGQGTRFLVYLPLSAPREPAPSRESPPFEPHTGHELILVAEDEPAVRDLVQGILTRFGYRVLLAEDGEQAVEQFSRHRDEIDLVLLDMVMPKLSGKAAFEEITRLKPGTRVLFTSGYAADVLKKKGEPSPGGALVVKPVHPLLLLREIRELLDR